MEKKIWFVPKSYGWGLIPISWQGWLATLFYIGLILAYLWYGYDLDKPELLQNSDTVKMVFDVCISAVAFIYMVEDKTEGKVGWYWGNMK